MTPSERVLAASIRQTLRQAYGALSEIENLVHNGGPMGYEPWEIDDEMQNRQLSFGRHIEKLFRDIKILAERLGLSETVADIKAATPTPEKAFETKPSSEGDYSSAHLTVAGSFFESLEALTDGKDVTGLAIFETILDSTPKIISAFNLDPKNEKEVQDAVLTALSFSFPDATRKVSISKIIKEYEPDVGVPSLHAAVEYKFIDSKEEAKQALDGTFTDMKGYGGSFEWRHFYAVYYMTDAFYSQREINAAYKLVDAERNWVPLVVVGRGARKKKKGKTAPKQKIKTAAKKKASVAKKP